MNIVSGRSYIVWWLSMYEVIEFGILWLKVGRRDLCGGR